MSPALAPSPHTRSSARWVRTFSTFETHRRSRLGWGYVLSGRSAVAKSSILRVVEFATASPWHFAWVPILYTTPTTIWVSSSVASRASLEKPKPLPLRLTNSLALCFTYSVQSSLMTKASSRDASRTLYSVPNSDCAGMLNVWVSSWFRQRKTDCSLGVDLSDKCFCPCLSRDHV